MNRTTTVGLAILVAVAAGLTLSRDADRGRGAPPSQAPVATSTPASDGPPSAGEPDIIGLHGADHPTPEQSRIWAWVDKGSSALDYGTKPIDAPLADRWDELERASRGGDPKAGLQLHFDLEECAFLRSKKARELLRPADKPAEGIDPQLAAEIDAGLDRIERARRNCAGISNDRINRSKEFLRQSAEAGNPYAALLYQDRGRPSEEESMRDSNAWSHYKDDTQRYLQGLAFRCVAEGIQRLAAMYRSRAYPASTSETAYAYYEWARLAWAARGVNADDPMREALMSQDLSELQRRTAQQRAHALFNRYCL